MDSGELNRRVWGVWAMGLAGLAVCAVLLAIPGWADDALPAARAVRLSSVEGHVQLVQGQQVLADPAVANVPLFEDTEVVTSEDGRAEIQFEDGSLVRIPPGSSLVLAVLRGTGTASLAEITLEKGLGYFELQNSGQAGVIRVRFGDNVVSSSGFTVLRVNVDNPPGELAVFSGNAHIERGTAEAADLHGGESATQNGGDAAQFKVAESIEPDSWDTWNSDRDQVLNSEAAAKTPATSSLANSANPAWSDLDANGNWYNVPGEGNVWSPNDAATAGWDPYGDGNWMWTPGYGYIWVSGYPWGYMPFQCGSWNYFDAFGWGWMPGPGGCGTPWWGFGYYGGINVGTGPIGYRPPLRPRPPNRPIRRVTPNGGTRFAAIPMVPVDRRPVGRPVGPPLRDRNAPVTIAGHVVQPIQPLRPLPSRGQYNRSDSMSGSLGGRTVPGAVRPGEPGYGYGHSSGAPAPRNPGSAPTYSPAVHSPSGGGHVSGGGGAAHASSGGGGGGGGGHASSGGSGGGGGGGHASSGGGGGGGGSASGGTHK